jgi:hypothetical protein
MANNHQSADRIFLSEEKRYQIDDTKMPEIIMRIAIKKIGGKT